METPWEVFDEILKQFKWRVEGLPMVRGRVVLLHCPNNRTTMFDCNITLGSKQLGRLRLHQPDSGVGLVVWRWKRGTAEIEHEEYLDLHAPDGAGRICEIEGISLTSVQVADRLADIFVRVAPDLK